METLSDNDLALSESFLDGLFASRFEKRKGKEVEKYFQESLFSQDPMIKKVAHSSYLFSASCFSNCHTL